MQVLAWYLTAVAWLPLPGRTPGGEQDQPKVAAKPVPTLVRTIPLPGVGGPIDSTGIRGRIDHLAYDVATGRLFVACKANGSLEVIDLSQGKRIKSLGGLANPQGVVSVGRPGLVVVSTGGDGLAHAFDAHSFTEKATVPVGEDADNVRLAPQGKVYVGFGGDEGPGGLAEIDPSTLTRTGTIPLPVRPEAFHFDPSGSRVFVNQPGKKLATADGTVLAVELATKKVQWARRLRNTARNYPMSTDPGHHRIFVASRLPPKLIVLDDRTGAVLSEQACAPDSDDVFFDGESRCVLVIGGGNRADNRGAEGDDGAGAAIDVFAVSARGALAKVASTPLPAHARTGLFVPERRAIYIAVPPLRGRAAEVREYKLGK